MYRWIDRRGKRCGTGEASIIVEIELCADRTTCDGINKVAGWNLTSVVD